jgi:hypothetical protein
MARLESQIRLGYYKTPVRVQNILSKILSTDVLSHESVNARTLHIFDPCAGTGEALAEIQKALAIITPVVSYGVELERNRALSCRQILNKSVQCSIFDLTTTKDSFGMMLLNPPYDHDQRIGNRATRLEKTFFKETVDYLSAKGILILIIPEQALETFLARSISYRFTDIRAFRFPVEEYARFRQIIIFGKRKEKGSFDADTADRLTDQLYNLPHLTDTPDFSYIVPATNGPKIFRDTHPTIEEMQMELPHSPLKKTIEHAFSASEGITSLSPLLPLTMGHLATLLMAGVMNGLISKGDKKIVVKGFTQQCKETTNQEVDSTTVKVIETTKTKASVRFFDAEGTLYNVE